MSGAECVGKDLGARGDSKGTTSLLEVSWCVGAGKRWDEAGK